MIVTRSDAMLSLRPGARFVLRDGEVQYYSHELPEPTSAEIEAELVRLKAASASLEYQERRASSYPPLKDFADAFYWQEQGDDQPMTAWLEQCKAVKSAHPKPDAK